jgi:prepilin-type N-terminal cleavage/methylation domain-containing protein
MKKCKIMPRPAGMTLVELVTAIIILGILTAIGMPGILGSIQRTGVDGASRRLTEDIRRAQSNALTRGVQARLIVFDQTGIVPTTPTAINDTTKANMYRIEIRSGASASWPALTDTPGSNPNVLTVWSDLGAQYRGVWVDTGNVVIFNSIGGLVNTTVPASITVKSSGETRSVQTNVIGKATIL